MQNRRKATEDDTFGILNRYRAVELRSGGMADVLICESELGDFKGRLALKVPKKWIPFDEETHQRWIYECYTWILLGKHPNIVSVDSLHLGAGLPYIAMEYVEDSLRDVLLRSGPVEPSVAIRYIINACDGLEHAANIVDGFVHRDLKPENILITRTGAGKVSDFGLIFSPARGGDIAKLHVDSPIFYGGSTGPHSTVTPPNPLLSRNGAHPGTPAYMAPEQINGATSLDQRADVYALGCVFYEILTGELVFGNLALDVYMRCHLSKQPVPPEEKNPAVSPKLSAVIMTCLEKDKAKRLASPASLGTQLRAIAVDDFGITVARPEAGPSDPNASFSVVDALIKLGDYSKARAICESQSQDSFWKRHFLAFITLREGDYSTAQKAFQNCLDQADSKVARTLALGGIGETCQKMGDLKQALGYFEQSTLEAPDQGVPLANTARVRGLLGDVQGAVAAYRKALGLAYDITFVLGLAEVLLQERMYDEAVEELSKALTMYADDVRLQHPLAEALSAKVLFYLNQHHLFLPGMTHEVQLAKSYALRSLEVGYLTERSSMLVRLCDRLLIVLRG